MKSNNKKWSLKNSYLDIPNCFYERIKPSLVKNPKLIYFNKKLAKHLNLAFLNDDVSLIIDYLSGNKLPDNSQPIAQAYAGHQFGRFTMLGDGRAILLGEKKDLNNKLYDIQLKGAGKTSFSRAGDGRATLSSMLREYLISESMHFLKIPTTRSLAVIDTGEKVYRETVNNGGILTRISSSHIRVGTFEYAEHFCSKEDFHNFTNYVIKRHYPDILDSQSLYLELLKLVMKKQIDLVIDWIRVGFIHGVMNTDNMSISGETIDYGPCAFLNTYDPKTVFSSIDHYGRYAFENQHKIAYWNLSVFAGTILQFIDSDQNKAIDLAQNILDQFPTQYTNKWYKMMYNKLGIINPKDEDKVLISELLKLMELKKADYTNTFAALTMNSYSKNSLFTSSEFESWKKKWKERVKNNENSLSIMKESNPIYIPRNHLVESALKSAINGNKEEFDKLLDIMSNTYNYNVKYDKFQTVPEDFDKSYKTFCGT
tara:strand:+ start:809 stop:2257 length:1449 start_codon:yes stop_codon:yes gene_type:complete